VERSSRSGRRRAVAGALGLLALAGGTATALLLTGTGHPAPGSAVVSPAPPGTGGPRSSAGADGGLTRRVVGSATATTRPGGTPVPAAATSTAPAPAPVPTSYVNCVTGSDAAPGTLARPWRTLARVRRVTFPAGTALALARGCTWNDVLQVNAPTAAASAGVQVGAYGAGAAPVLSGAGLAVPSVVTLTGTRVTLSDVVVTRAAHYGIQMFGPAGTVRDVSVTRSGIGVRALGAGSVIDRVAASDLQMIVNTPGGSDDYGAVGFDVEADGVRITRSTCTRCRAASHDWGHDGGFVEVWNHGDDLVVSDSTASETEGFLEIGGDSRGTSARRVRILRNTLNDVHGGFFVHGSDQFSLATGDILVSGNRIVERTAATNGVLAGDLHSVEFTDNVVVAAQPFAFTAPAVHSGNTYYLPDAAHLGFPLGAGETLHPLAAAP